MKKWFPFLLLLIFISVSLAFLFLSKEDSEYTPKTDNAAIIYHEACMHCHGNKGQGSGFFYPAFEKDLTEEEIYKKIENGALLMPAFTYIKGDTLDKLVEYIHSGSYAK